MRGWKPWTTQPPAGTPIDWDNPLSAGLIDVIEFNGTPRSAILHTPAVFPNNSHGTNGALQGAVRPPQGRAWDSTAVASNYGAGMTFSRSDGKYTPAALTHVGLLKVTAVAQNYTGVFGSMQAGTAATGGARIWADPAAGNYFVTVGGGVATVAVPKFTWGAAHVVGFGADAGGGDVYVDGGLAYGPNTTLVPSAESTSELALFINIGVSQSASGNYWLHLIYGRRLAALEHALLGRNPWQVYWKRRRTYSIASGGTVIAASLAESGSAADSLAAQLAAVAALSESGSASSSLSALASFVSTLAEAASAADSPSATKVTSASSAESGSASDSVTSGAAQAVAIAEAGSAAAAVSASLVAVSSLSASGSAADVVHAVLAATAALDESGTAVDSLSTASGILVSLAEAGTAANSLAAAAARAASVAEAGSVSEAVSAALAAVTSIAEAGSASDAVSWSGNVYSVSVAESGAAAMTIQAAEFAVATLASSGGAADTLSALADLQAALGEAGHAVDELHAVGDFTVVLTDAANAADVINWLSGRNAQGADRIVMLPFGKRIVVVGYGRRVGVSPQDNRILVTPTDPQIN